MEREADRLGLGLMQPAGFEAQGFVGMFEKLQQSARLSDSGNFPYLRSHPMTTERMGDMQQRLLISQHSPQHSSQQSPSKTATEPDFQHAMMAARARVLAEPGIDVLRLWAVEPQAAGFATLSKSRQVASLYAAILANIKLRDFSRANEQKNKLKTLIASDLIASTAIKIIAIEISLLAGDVAAATTQAAELVEKKTLSQQPLSRPELFTYAKVHIAAADASKPQLAPQAQSIQQATQSLRTWVVQNPADGPAWQLLGAAYKATGQPLRAIRAEAEAQVAVLDYTAALDRFKAAQDMVRNGAIGVIGAANGVANGAANGAANAGRDFMEESIIDVRTRQVQELLKQQIKDEKEAAK
jgi:predicted Zn-dependent protease